MYKPTVVFFGLGTLLAVAGLIPFVRYFIFLAHRSGPHYLQSLIVGSILLISALIVYALGVIADLVRINRSLIEDYLGYTKEMYYGNKP